MTNRDAVKRLTDASRVQSLITELDWCIANGHAGPRTAQAIEHARAVIAALAPTAEQADAVRTVTVTEEMVEEAYGPYLSPVADKTRRECLARVLVLAASSTGDQA